VAEHPNGLKQFRFNDKIAADLEVSENGHNIQALLGNGDHMHMLDNVQEGYMHFLIKTACRPGSNTAAGW